MQPFQPLSRDVFDDVLQKLEGDEQLQFVCKLGSDAYLALQLAPEAPAEAVMTDMALHAQHCHRLTIVPEDLQTLLVLRRR